MIQTETLTIGEKQYIRTYSDAGMMIHGGFPKDNYDEAIDPAELGRVYTETEIPIEGESEAEEIVSILTGESE